MGQKLKQSKRVVKLLRSDDSQVKSVDQKVLGKVGIGRAGGSVQRNKLQRMRAKSINGGYVALVR